VGREAGRIRRGSLLLGLLAVAALVAGTGQAQAVTIKEFSPAGTTGKPLGITAGPDGNLWFTTVHVPSGSIFRMTPEGGLTEFVEHGEGVGGPITVGPDGNLWFTGTDGGGGTSLGRVTLEGAITPIISGLGHAGAPPITGGPDGNLWEAVSGHLSNSEADIYRITTAGDATAFGVPTHQLGGTNLTEHLLGGIALGPDGNLWFTEGNGYLEEGVIGRITLEGAITQFPTGNSFLEGGGLHGITAGPDGNLWFTDEVGEIGRITAQGVVTEFSTGITPASRPYEIAAGPDGNLWFTEPGSKRIGRITPKGVVTEFSEGITGEPLGITAGPDDSLWFTESPGQIGQVVLSAPTAVTNPVSLVAQTAATLTATVNPNGQKVSGCRFEYGASPSYGSRAPCTFRPGSGERPVNVFAPIAGLRAGTNYHFRIVATNSEGIGYGSDTTFTTLPPPNRHLPQRHPTHQRAPLRWWHGRGSSRFG
jgi:streptogramin lyase